MKLLQLFGIILAAIAVCTYQLYEDDIKEYDDEVNDAYQDIMQREVDDTDDIPDKIKLAMKSLKKDEWQQVLAKEGNSNDDFGDYVQDPVPGRRRRRRRRRWRIRIRGRKVLGYYRQCCASGLCSPRYCFG